MQDKPKVDKAEVDKAFEALKSFDWGSEPKVLKGIDDAIVATAGDADAKELEARLAAVLKTNISRAAKDFVCRALRVVGTAASVPTLAAMLEDKDLSHPARYALERIPAPEAGKALCAAVDKVNGPLKAGVIGSLGVRGDDEAVAALIKALGDGDAAIARAAACALGNIGTAEAAKALVQAKAQGAEEVKNAVADAAFVAAEKLAKAGKKAEAVAVYKAFSGSDQPKHIRLAATRGMLGK